MSKERLYLAYGSNLNLQQMENRCPTAKVVGKTFLRGWSLWFRGSGRNAVATIEHRRGFKIPALVWEIQPLDEAALDRYEGYPYLYHKETLRVTVDGHRRYAMVYIMNEEHRRYGTPSERYINIIRDGYEAAGFDKAVLDEAIRNSQDAAKWEARCGG